MNTPSKSAKARPPDPTLMLIGPLVPRAPEIEASRCSVSDNSVTVAWQPAGEADGDVRVGRPVESFELEYRKSSGDSSLRGACWEKILDIREPHVTISGRRAFDRRNWRANVSLLTLAC